MNHSDIISNYFAIIPNRHANPMMIHWIEDNINHADYEWQFAPGARAIYFKYERDLLVFRLRWGL